MYFILILISHTSVWPINRTLIITTSPGQSEPSSNINEGLFSKLELYQFSIIHRVPFYGEVLSLCKGIQSAYSRVTYKPLTGQLE